MSECVNICTDCNVTEDMNELHEEVECLQRDIEYFANFNVADTAYLTTLLSRMNCLNRNVLDRLDKVLLAQRASEQKKSQRVRSKP